MNHIYQSFIQAESINDLTEKLGRLNIDVPKRSERTKEHTEKYIICRFLSTFADKDLFSYPFIIQKGERPDFLFNFMNEYVGVEVTEAASSSYSSYIALAERERPEHFLDFGHFSNGENWTLSQKRDLLNKNSLTSHGWVGDSMEKSWAKFISEAIKRKSRKFLNNGFQKFHQNWLLIYDNTPTAFLTEEYLIPCIEGLLAKNDTCHFDRIFIETSWEDDEASSNTAKIIELSSKGFKIFTLRNLWK